MTEYVEGRGDFWLWAAMDSDTKLVLSHNVDRRNTGAIKAFMYDLSSRIEGPVQLVSDAYPGYATVIPRWFYEEGYTYGTETKVFIDPQNPVLEYSHATAGLGRVAKAKREAVIGTPDLDSLTTAHVERLFLTFRQELARLGRMTLAYSKDADMHRWAIALTIGVYNLARKHQGLGGQTPAQAAGVEEKRWTMEDVVTMTEAYWAPKYAKQAVNKAAAKRAAEDKAFMVAMTALEIL